MVAWIPQRKSAVPVLRAAGVLGRMVDRLTGSGDVAQAAAGVAATHRSEAHHHLALALAGMGADRMTGSVVFVVEGGHVVAGGMFDLDADGFGTDGFGTGR